MKKPVRLRVRNNRDWWYNIRFTFWHVLESILLVITLGKVSGGFVITFCSNQCKIELEKAKAEKAKFEKDKRELVKYWTPLQ